MRPKNNITVCIKFWYQLRCFLMQRSLKPWPKTGPAGMDLTQCLRVSVTPQPETVHSVPLLKAWLGRQAVLTKGVSLAQYGLFVALSWSKAVEEGTKAKSTLISAYFIAKFNKSILLDNNFSFSNLTNVIMKSKKALPVLVMHDGALHLNSLIVRFILLYIHSSQNHLHFNSGFSSEEFRLMSKVRSKIPVQIKSPSSTLTCSGPQWAPSTTRWGRLHRCVWRTQGSSWTGSARTPAKDEPPGETSSPRRSWLSSWAVASHTGRTGYCLLSGKWAVWWVELAEKQKGLRRDTRACVHLCLRVYVCVFTTGTFPNFTMPPLRPVFLFNKAPGLTITIRVPTQRILKNQQHVEDAQMFLCQRVQYFPCDLLSPAVIVWPNSIKAGILLEWVDAILQDEVGIPVQTLFVFTRHAHQTTVRFSILFVTVVWPSRQKEKNDNRLSTQWDVCSEWSVGGLGREGFTNFAESSAVPFRAGTVEAGAFATLHASARILTRIRTAGRGCAKKWSMNKWELWKT